MNNGGVFYRRFRPDVTQEAARKITAQTRTVSSFIVNHIEDHNAEDHQEQRVSRHKEKTRRQIMK